MDDTSPLPQKHRTVDSCEHRPAQTTNHAPKRLILADPRRTWRIQSGYLELEEGGAWRVIGLQAFDEIYIHKSLPFTIEALYTLSKTLKVHLIDANGNLLGRFKRYKL